MSKLSVIVPVYNEGPILEDVLNYLMESDCPIEREWIFVDDCSKDNSFAVLEEFSKKHPITLLRQEKNRGKGAAIARGIKEASGDFIIIQDADFEYDPTDIPKLLEPLLEGRADAVFGSRFKGSFLVHRTFHYFVNRSLTMLSNLLSGIYLTDMETCYKVFRAEILRSMNLTSPRFGIEVEVTAYLAKLRLRLFEIPINYRPRTHLQGKKINWRDGVAALYHLIYFNWFVSREQAFRDLPGQYLGDAPHFVSTKEGL